MNVTETLSPSLVLPVEPVPADWGHFDCQRLATAAEMAAASNTCECGDEFVSKVGGGTVQGTVLGYRFSPQDLWVWSAPLCRSCETAHAVADGY